MATRRKPKILLAEDDETHAQILLAVLGRAGYEVIWVQNGLEAYDLIRTQSYNLLLTDVMMPAMSGFELIERLRNESIMPATIVLTAKQGDEDILRGLECGAKDYISKPFSLSVVL